MDESGVLISTEELRELKRLRLSRLRLESLLVVLGPGGLVGGVRLARVVFGDELG